MANSHGDEEAQALVGHEGANIQKNPKPAWLDHSGQLSAAIFAAAAAVLVPLLSTQTTTPQLVNRVPSFLLWFLFSVCTLNFHLVLFKKYISDSNNLSLHLKRLFTFLTLITGTAITTLNLALLYLVDKSYLVFTVVPVLQFVLLSVAYFELKSYGNHILPEDNESIAKNCFKVAKTTTVACYALQTAAIIPYMQNPNIPKDHPQYTLLVPFSFAALGSSAMIITSLPLDIISGLDVCTFLQKIPIIMPISVAFSASFLAAEFLDDTKVVVAWIVPLIMEFTVTVIKKFWEQQATEDTLASTDSIEIDSMFETVAGFSIILLSASYTYFWSYGYDSYLLKLASFFLLLSIICCAIRMALPSRPTRMNIEHIKNLLPVVGSLVGLVLLYLSHDNVKQPHSAGKPFPSPTPVSPPR